ncbi:hypothetical protein DL96DRAFT_1613693 [Flagelloscypha sp. PMI_526]|nr:hypothetical protein DL96DRAFT_1613693 [Flagelloscypha sp. PMI_526]
MYKVEHSATALCQASRIRFQIGFTLSVYLVLARRHGLLGLPDHIPPPFLSFHPFHSFIRAMSQVLTVDGPLNAVTRTELVSSNIIMVVFGTKGSGLGRICLKNLGATLALLALSIPSVVMNNIKRGYILKFGTATTPLAVDLAYTFCSMLLAWLSSSIILWKGFNLFPRNRVLLGFVITFQTLSLSSPLAFVLFVIPMMEQAAGAFHLYFFTSLLFTNLVVLSLVMRNRIQLRSSPKTLVPNEAAFHLILWATFFQFVLFVASAVFINSGAFVPLTYEDTLMRPMKSGVHTGLFVIELVLALLAAMLLAKTSNVESQQWTVMSEKRTTPSQENVRRRPQLGHIRLDSNEPLNGGDLERDGTLYDWDRTQPLPLPPSQESPERVSTPSPTRITPFEPESYGSLVLVPDEFAPPIHRTEAIHAGVIARDRPRSPSPQRVPSAHLSRPPSYKTVGTVRSPV